MLDTSDSGILRLSYFYHVRSMTSSASPHNLLEARYDKSDKLYCLRIQMYRVEIGPKMIPVGINNNNIKV
jgi:hypothetical protein